MKFLGNSWSVLGKCSADCRWFLWKYVHENSQQKLSCPNDFWTCKDLVVITLAVRYTFFRSNTVLDGPQINRSDSEFQSSDTIKLRLHDAIYRLRFYWNSLIQILSHSNLHNNDASIQKNRGNKSHHVILIWSCDYTMWFIGYNSIQTRWFISYRFQFCTITWHHYKRIGAINHTV